MFDLYDLNYDGSVTHPRTVSISILLTLSWSATEMTLAIYINIWFYRWAKKSSFKARNPCWNSTRFECFLPNLIIKINQNKSSWIHASLSFSTSDKKKFYASNLPYIAEWLFGSWMWITMARSRGQNGSTGAFTSQGWSEGAYDYEWHANDHDAGTETITCSTFTIWTAMASLTQKNSCEVHPLKIKIWDILDISKKMIATNDVESGMRWRWGG